MKSTRHDAKKCDLSCSICLPLAHADDVLFFCSNVRRIVRVKGAIIVHVVAKFIRSISHNVTCNDLIGLLKSCSVLWALCSWQENYASLLSVNSFISVSIKLLNTDQWCLCLFVPVWVYMNIVFIFKCIRFCRNAWLLSLLQISCLGTIKYISYFIMDRVMEVNYS